jgi:hypothetical protein
MNRPAALILLCAACSPGYDCYGKCAVGENVPARVGVKFTVTIAAARPGWAW